MRGRNGVGRGRAGGAARGRRWEAATQPQTPETRSNGHILLASWRDGELESRHSEMVFSI